DLAVVGIDGVAVLAQPSLFRALRDRMHQGLLQRLREIDVELPGAPKQVGVHRDIGRALWCLDIVENAALASFVFHAHKLRASRTTVNRPSPAERTPPPRRPTVAWSNRPSPAPPTHAPPSPRP